MYGLFQLTIITFAIYKWKKSKVPLYLIKINGAVVRTIFHKNKLNEPWNNYGNKYIVHH